MKTVAKILLFDTHDNVLILFRGATHPNFPGHADLPGGEINLGEEPADAVVRELFEETGLIIDVSQMTLQFAVQHDRTTRHLLYKATLAVDPPRISLSWEHDKYAWIPYAALLAQALPPNVDPYYKRVVGFLKVGNTN